MQDSTSQRWTNDLEPCYDSDQGSDDSFAGVYRRVWPPGRDTTTQRRSAVCRSLWIERRPHSCSCCACTCMGEEDLRPAPWDLQLNPKPKVTLTWNSSKPGLGLGKGCAAQGQPRSQDLQNVLSHCGEGTARRPYQDTDPYSPVPQAQPASA